MIFQDDDNFQKPHTPLEKFDEHIKMQENELNGQDAEFMYISRRRLSLDMKPQVTGLEINEEIGQLLTNFKCANTFPYKIVVLGDEETSGKIEMLNYFTLSEILQQQKNFENYISDIIFENQCKVIEVKDPSDGIQKNYCIQLWSPMCTQQYENIRTMLYPATDAFIIFFSLSDHQTFQRVVNQYLPEVRHYILQDKPHLRDVPIILVGNHAEKRDILDPRDIVMTQDVLETARKFSVSKYIEIRSKHLFHCFELFQQAVLAIQHNHNSKSEVFPLEHRKQQFIREYESFKSYITVPTPVGTFDLMDRTFELSIDDESVEYFVSFDGSDPFKMNFSQKYIDPIHIRKPFPSVIKVIGYKRGKFESDMAVFQVPQESSLPEAYFDSFTKAFHIIQKPNTTYFLTTDGSTPNQGSMIYQDPGLMFDDNKPNRAFSSSNIKIPNVIKVIAVESNKFRSNVASFEPFGVISPPVVHYNSVDTTLKIVTIPGLVYKYTLDGSTPSFDSPSYTSPIMIPRNHNCKIIKVAAFPKYYFPSRTVEVVRSDNGYAIPSGNGSSDQDPLHKPNEAKSSSHYNYFVNDSSALSPQNSPVRLTNAFMENAKFISSGGNVTVTPKRQSPSSNRRLTPTQSRVSDTPKKKTPLQSSSYQKILIVTPSSKSPQRHYKSPNKYTITPSKSYSSLPNASYMSSSSPNVTYSTKSPNASSHQHNHHQNYQNYHEDRVKKKRIDEKQPKSPHIAAGYTNPIPSHNSDQRNQKHSYEMDSFPKKIHEPQTFNPSPKRLPTTSPKAVQHSNVVNSSNEQQSNAKQHQHYSFEHQQESHQENHQQSQQSQQHVDVLCRVEGTNVEFEFEKPVYVTRLFVKTPGRGRGPSGYECYAVDEQSSNLDLIGRGYLGDIEAEQVMNLFHPQKQPLRKLLCSFKMAQGQNTFKILDIRVDCKRFQEQ